MSGIYFRKVFGLLSLLFLLFWLVPSHVSAGTWTLTLTPKCPVASDVPLSPVYPMYAFWPPPNSSALNWTFGAQTKTTSTITVTNPRGSTVQGGYVALMSTAGGAIPGLSSTPTSSYIDPTWSGWNPITKMFRFDALNLPSGNYNFNYQLAAGTCGTPGYTFNVTTPPGAYLEGQNISMTWNYSYVNQPVESTVPYKMTVKLFRPNNITTGTTATLGTFSMSPGTGALTYPIPFTLQPASDYVVNISGTGPVLRAGPTSNNNALFASSNAVTIAIPPPTNFKGVCTGTTGTFTWNQPNGISNYYWRLTDLTSNVYVGNEDLGITNITGTSFTYDKMIHGHNYRAWMHSKIPTAPTPNWSDAVYSEFNCPAPSPTPSPTRTPTPTPSFTPSPTPTPDGYCTTQANCSGGKVCVNNGCQVPSPTQTTAPSNTPTITPTSTPIATPTPNCSLRSHGDANCDCTIDSADYTIWRKEFLNEIPQERADFSKKAECKNTDGSTNFVCTYDLDIWRDGMTKGLTCENTKPTSGPTGTPIPASTVMPSPTNPPVLPTVVVQPTSTPTPMPPTVTPPALPPLAQNNYQLAKQQFLTDEGSLISSDINAITVVSAESAVWNDGCMGCGGKMCTQAITSGYRIILSSKTTADATKCMYRAYHYRTNATSMCTENGATAGIVAACGTNPYPALTNSSSAAQ